MLRDKLIEILNKTEVSQSEIARQLKVHRQQITNWKNGNVKIPYEKLEQICKITGCKLHIVINYT